MYSKAEIQKMKDWFGDGEFDIDLMISMGSLTENNLIHFCRTLTDSPWYDKGYHRYLCERCGGHGEQPAGCWDGTAYAAKAGTCDDCKGEGYLGTKQWTNPPSQPKF